MEGFSDEKTEKIIKSEADKLESELNSLTTIPGTGGKGESPKPSEPMRTLLDVLPRGFIEFIGKAPQWARKRAVLMFASDDLPEVVRTQFLHLKKPSEEEVEVTKEIFIAAFKSVDVSKISPEMVLLIRFGASQIMAGVDDIQELKLITAKYYTENPPQKKAEV